MGASLHRYASWYSNTSETHLPAMNNDGTVTLMHFFYHLSQVHHGRCRYWNSMIWPGDVLQLFHNSLLLCSI